MKRVALGGNWALALALMTVLALTPQAGSAGLPQTMNYQGSLSDSLGAPVNGPVDMTFTLYDALTGGAALWTETQTVQVTSGIFNVQLGAVVPLTTPLFDNTVYLGIAVGLDPEMTPRQTLDVFGYSLRSHGAINAFNLICTACVAEGELGFDAATQTELDAHAATAEAHHTRYTDAEAIEAVGPHTVDTTLGNAEVDAFVVDGALDLFAGTTLNGAAIQTGADADTLGGLICGDGEVAKKVSGVWSCAADATGGTASDLVCENCVAEAELGFDAANQTELDAHAATAEAHHARYTDAEAIEAVGPHTVDTDTLADLACSDGQVAKKVSGVWDCAVDVDTDTDTRLNEAQVENYVTNGALDLAAGTTLNGAGIQTGADAGLTGVTVREVADTILGGGTGSITAPCVGSEVVLGGGFKGAPDIAAYSSYPDAASSPEAWVGGFQNTEVLDISVTVYAVCGTP
jgi:hypothetical protein